MEETLVRNDITSAQATDERLDISKHPHSSYLGQVRCHPASRMNQQSLPATATPDCLSMCLAISRLSSCRKVWSALQAELVLLLAMDIGERAEGRGGAGKEGPFAAAGSNDATNVLVMCRRASCTAKSVPKEPQRSSLSSSGASWGQVEVNIEEVVTVLYWW